MARALMRAKGILLPVQKSKRRLRRPAATTTCYGGVSVR